MTLPKFIITMDGFFRLGMVNQHKDLLKPGDQCIGGGYVRKDNAPRTCSIPNPEKYTKNDFYEFLIVI